MTAKSSKLKPGGQEDLEDLTSNVTPKVAKISQEN